MIAHRHLCCKSGQESKVGHQEGGNWPLQSSGAPRADWAAVAVALWVAVAAAEAEIAAGQQLAQQTRPKKNLN